MNINIMNFMGTRPKVSPHLLPENFSTSAGNCNFESGSLQAVRQSDAGGNVFTTTTRKSIYLYNKESGGFWFQRDTDVDWVRGQLANDNFQRIYFTGDGAPKMTFVDIAQGGSPGDPYPLGSRTLGIPAPGWFTAVGPPVEPIEDGEGEVIDPTGGAQIISTSYVMTYVSDLGEEGPPSPATNIVERYDGGTVSLSGMPVPTAGSNIQYKRLYRIELNGVYQFVREIPAATTDIWDARQSAALGEPLPSEGWIAPHSDMIGLTALPNGIMAGFWKNTVAFCVPYQPHAWPVSYRYAIDHDVVGLAVSAYGLVVITKGNPYLIVGSSPETMQVEKLDVVQAGISKRSVVDMGDYVIFASREGLVAVGGRETKLLTDSFITAEQWRSMYRPETIHAYRWQDKYLGFYGTGSGQRSFMFSPVDGFIDYDEWCTAAYLDAEDGTLYMAQGNQVRMLQQGFSYMGLQWLSKEFHYSPMDPIRVCKVDIEEFEHLIPPGEEMYFPYIIFHEGERWLKWSSITNSKGAAIRLPVVKRRGKLRVEIVYPGSHIPFKINRIQLASSMSEIY